MNNLPVLTTDNKFDLLKEILATKESRFFSLVYTNSNNEMSLYLLHYNLNFRRVYERDQVILSNYKPENELESVVKEEMLASIQNSLDTDFHNVDYTLDNYYTKLSGAVDFHKEDLYMKCFVVKKTVLIKGEYPKVNKREKTIVKDKLSKMLKKSKIRTFKLDLEQIHNIKINGKTIEIS